MKALKESGAPIPKDLQVLADAFNEKRKAGTVQAHGTGYGGTGFKFDTTEEEERRAARKVCAIPATSVFLKCASFAAAFSLLTLPALQAPRTVLQLAVLQLPWNVWLVLMVSV